MEAENENNSEKNKKNARQFRKNRLYREVNELSEQEAKDQLFKLLNSSNEKDEIIASKDKIIERFRNKLENNDIYAGYKFESHYTDKIIFIFRRYGKLMTTQELKKELIKCEPNLAQAWIDPLKSVSEIVYRSVKINCVIRYKKAGVYGFTYGLPEWFDDNNHLIKKYIR